MRAEPLAAARERLRPYVEKARLHEGWSFELDAHRLSQKPWDYMDRARELVSNAESVLDLGTGGGERFGEILRASKSRAVATEEWHVNAPLAARNLRPLAVSVVRCRSVQLPFCDAAFDLVLDRHEELDPLEVGRVLKPGGEVPDAAVLADL